MYNIGISRRMAAIPVQISTNHYQPPAKRTRGRTYLRQICPCGPEPAPAPAPEPAPAPAPEPAPAPGQYHPPRDTVEHLTVKAIKIHLLRASINTFGIRKTLVSRLKAHLQISCTCTCTCTCTCPCTCTCSCPCTCGGKTTTRSYPSEDLQLHEAQLTST